MQVEKLELLLVDIPSSILHRTCDAQKCCSESWYDLMNDGRGLYVFSTDCVDANMPDDSISSSSSSSRGEGGGGGDGVEGGYDKDRQVSGIPHQNRTSVWVSLTD